MTSAWALISSGDYSGAAAKVQKMRDADTLSLRMRVNRMIEEGALLAQELSYLNWLTKQ